MPRTRHRLASGLALASLALVAGCGATAPGPGAGSGPVADPPVPRATSSASSQTDASAGPSGTATPTHATQPPSRAGRSTPRATERPGVPRPVLSARPEPPGSPATALTSSSAAPPPQVPDAVRLSATRGMPAGTAPTAVPAPSTAAPSATPAPPEEVHVVQANLYTRLPTDRLAADLLTVFGGAPDFVTLNEVGRRTDAQITPAGYAVHRSAQNVWTAETAVLWRTDRWEELSTGTRYLTERRVAWGLRAVNWVTVRDRSSGRVVSVVSAHAPPTTVRTHGLLDVYAQGLSDLVGQLGLQGAVIVGGDLNVGYLSPAWPAATWSESGLVPTYDVLGRPVGGTGDDHHATIDYVLYQRDHGLVPLRQGTATLNSDHRAVWSVLRLG